jgi:hypothetical protein
MLDGFKDRLVNIRLRKDEKLTALGFVILGVVIVILIINIVYLNFVLFNSKNNSDGKISSQASTTSFSASTTQSTIASILPTTSTIQNNNNTSISQNTGVKDYFIPLGSGMSQATDWEDVPGVLAAVDFGQYQNIKEIKLEASVFVPTGNEIVWVRLFNKTDGHPVWYSEASAVSNANSYLISSPIAYDFGQKTYQIQIKTQLGALANLAQSRIHVSLK